jgi:hypothetical protein
MNSLIHQSISAYRRQKEAQMIFRENTVKIVTIFRNFEKLHQTSNFEPQSVQEKLFILMTPLIEVAWADGRIRTKEQESIIQVAEYYGLIDNFEIYSKLMERLSNRPVSFQREQSWQKIRELFSALPNKERETILANLIQQSQFIAEISQKWMFGYWRGSRMGEHEREILNDVTQRLDEINKELKAKNFNYEVIAHNSQIMKTKSKNTRF